MTSGRVQVATTGIQDVFLTGTPDVTYFQKKFKRHTKFALELLDNVFNESADFGKTVRATIDRKGDLIRNVFLRVKLSDLSTADSNNAGYTDSIGHAMIDYADLIIGGQTVQRITGEYMEIYTDMFIPQSQQTAITALVGKTGTVDGLGPASSTTPGPFGKYPKTLFVHLPFYYTRSDPLSIPLSALTRQEVEIVIKFKPLSQLIVIPGGGTPPPTTGSIISASLPVEYVFLDIEEIDYMRNTRLDYVITQLQLAQTTIEPGVTEPKFRLEFTNPVKELYFIIQNQSNVQANDWFNFTNPENEDNLKGHQLLTVKLEFNGETFLDSEVADTSFMYAIQAMNRHTRVPDRFFYTYSFALDPENYIPTGQVNMSRIQNKIVTLKLSDSTDTRKIRIYAKSYNVLRIENGLAGVLFIDNNFI
jgi:hypothetical protein